MNALPEILLYLHAFLTGLWRWVIDPDSGAAYLLAIVALAVVSLLATAHTERSGPRPPRVRVPHVVAEDVGLALFWSIDAPAPPLFSDVPLYDAPLRPRCEKTLCLPTVVIPITR